ncbi:MAG TPA: phosphatidate cytidylyltransferase [Gemmatimonadales bacterium]|nr:phosphatidate cytidylyltransferase [Gemmatimonadales bacterium]
MSRNLLQRIAFAVVAIPLAVGLVWWGGWPLAGVLALLGVLGAREVYGLARRQGIDALDGMGLAAAAIPLATYWVKGSESRWAEPTIYAGALWLLALLVGAMRRGPGRRPLVAVSVTAFGVLYASALPSFLIAIRHGANAGVKSWPLASLVLLPLALTWICDTAAMAAGNAIGGPKLAPVLSPNKTWAGAIGGFLAAVVAAVLLGGWVLPRVGLPLDAGRLVLVGAAVGLVAQVGDVAESLFKREVQVKDSSNLIPGHGGVLDRLDSLYFVLPVSAGLFRLFGLV